MIFGVSINIFDYIDYGCQTATGKIKKWQLRCDKSNNGLQADEIGVYNPMTMFSVF